MKKLMILFVFSLVMTTAAIAAAHFQVATTPEIDPETVDAILLTGVGGLGVLALTEMAKRLLNAAGALSYITSGVVSAAATAIYLAMQQQFTLLAFMIYSVLVFLSANGIYKVVVKASRGR